MSNITKEELETLATIFLKARNKLELTRLLQDLFSNKELETLILRADIAKRLYRGESYETIERETGASSATIAKISESLKYGKDGLITVLNRMRR